MSKPNSGATRGGFTVTGKGKAGLGAIRRESPKPRQAPKGVRRPSK